MSSSNDDRPISGSAVRTGTALTIIGFGGYLGSGMASKTALIPAALGAPMITLGALANLPAIKKIAVPGAVGLALIAMAGTARGVKALPDAFAGNAERPGAVMSQAATFAVSAAFLWRVMRG